MVNAGKYTSPMDPMGMTRWKDKSEQLDMI